MTTSDQAPAVAGLAPPPGQSCFVAVSEFTVPVEGRTALLAAFDDRLGAVDSWAGFQGMQVWAAADDPSAFTMVSWWDDEACFAAYMGSPDHRTSHARIPRGEHRPRPSAFRRFQVVAT